MTQVDSSMWKSALFRYGVRQEHIGMQLANACNDVITFLQTSIWLGHTQLSIGFQVSKSTRSEISPASHCFEFGISLSI